MDKQNIENLYAACAEAAHEMNRIYCCHTGDVSQLPWHDAPAWQRESAINGVRGVIVDGNDPEASHANWLAEKIATGWVWGPVKDAVAKTHPCLLPYAELPAAQAVKDTLFVTTVRQMFAALHGVPF